MREYGFYFFDLFHTLVLLEPNPVLEENEFSILGIPRAEWTRVAMQDYERRATGELRDPEAIIESIVSNAGICIDAEKRSRLVEARKKRYRRTFSVIRPSVLATLSALHAAGKTLVLVSNADALDSLYWEESPLSRYFSEAIFSWKVGCMKPALRIYELAMESVGAVPGKSVFIGDGGHDELAGAKQAGLDTVLTTELITDLWPEAIPRLAVSADYVVGSLSELCGGDPSPELMNPYSC
jgi:putative hydrolase of the HAD superfamily